MAENNGDFIPDDQFTPDQEASPAPASASPATPQQSATPTAPTNNPPDFVADDQFKPDDETKAPAEPSMLDPIKAGIEGLERGLTFGASDYIRAHGDPILTGQSSEEATKELAQRKEQNPISAGVGSFLGSGLAIAGTEGLGEAALGLNSGIESLPAWTKLGANILKGGIIGSAIQGGDEISKSILGENPPDDAVASALTNVGVSGLIGGGISGALGLGGIGFKAIANTRLGHKAADALADFSKSWTDNVSAGNKVDAMANELKDFHESTSEIGDLARGTSGLKSQAIDKLSQSVQPEQLVKHLDKVNEILANAPKAMTEDKLFQDTLNNWKSATETTNDPAAIFRATDALKKQMQEWGQYNRAMVPLSEQPFRNAAKGIGHDVRESLEDTGVWGDLGSLQKNFNKATSDLIPAQKDFNSKFAQKVQGEPVVDPDKIRTYINQVNNDKGSLRQGILKSYLDAANEYRSKIADMHNSLGLQSPIQSAPLTVTNMMLGKPSPSAQAATYLHDVLVPKIGAKVSAGTAGSLIGGAAGALSSVPGGQQIGSAVGGLAGNALSDKLIPAFEATLGRPIKKYAIPTVIRALQSGLPESTGAALDYADQVNKGDYFIKNSIKDLLTGASQKVYNGEASDSDKKKLKDFIEKGGTGTQMQNEVNSLPIKPQNFAHGGEVKGAHAKDPTQSISLPNTSGLESALPEHASGIQQARARVYNYLNTVRPQKSAQTLPFDEHPDQSLKEKHYDRALNLAIHPLGILNKVKDGSLGMEDLKHFGNMYPELHQHLSKRITKSLMENKMDKEKKPNYKTRQALSLFLGSPLDTTMTPAGILAAQATYAPAGKTPDPSQPQGKTKKGTTNLGKSNKSYMTASESAESDRTSRD